MSRTSAMRWFNKEDKMDAAFEYDAETGKIEQVQGEKEEKSQT